MPKLDDNIKEALITLRASDYCEMMQEPTYQKFVRDFTKDLVNNIKKTVFTKTDTEEDEMIAKTLNPDTICDGMLKDETNLRENAYNNARGQFLLSRSDAESIFNTQKMLPPEEDDDSREVAAAFKPVLDKFFKDLEPQYRFNSALVTELAKIAKKSGTEKAVLRQTVNKTIKKLIPTADEYVALRQKQADTVSEFIMSIQKVVASFAEDEDDEEIRMIRTMFASIVQSLSTRLIEDALRREAQKIYG